MFRCGELALTSGKSKDLREGYPEGIKGWHLSCICYGPTTGCIRILETEAQRESPSLLLRSHTHTHTHTHRRWQGWDSSSQTRACALSHPGIPCAFHFPASSPTLTPLLQPQGPQAPLSLDPFLSTQLQDRGSVSRESESPGAVQL